MQSAVVFCVERYSKYMNLLTPAGFVFALSALALVRNNGFVWFAPPCSSWTIVSRGSTKRTQDEPLGKHPRYHNVGEREREREREGTIKRERGHERDRTRITEEQMD